MWDMAVDIHCLSIGEQFPSCLNGTQNDVNEADALQERVNPSHRMRNPELTHIAILLERTPQRCHLLNDISQLLQAVIAAMLNKGSPTRSIHTYIHSRIHRSFSNREIQRDMSG
jgi:hypothetical protein